MRRLLDAEFPGGDVRSLERERAALRHRERGGCFHGHAVRDRERVGVARSVPGDDRDVVDPQVIGVRIALLVIAVGEGVGGQVVGGVDAGGGGERDGQRQTSEIKLATLPEAVPEMVATSLVPVMVLTQGQPASALHIGHGTERTSSANSARTRSAKARRRSARCSPGKSRRPSAAGWRG